MLTLKVGLTELKNQPVIKPQLLTGLLDTIRVLNEKLKDNDELIKLYEEIELASRMQFTIQSVRSILGKVMQSADTIRLRLNPAPESEISWWLHSLISQASNAYNETEGLTFWENADNVPAKFTDMWSAVQFIPTLSEIANGDLPVLEEINKWSETDLTSEEKLWLTTLHSHIKGAQVKAKEMHQIIDQLSGHCDDLADYEYNFLYDQTQHFLAIGYNVEEHKRDPGYYDLLGSEARLAVYVAIAQGKIPQESWFALGRQLTNSGTDPVLISWSGSMFEYLMPLLLTPSYESTLLDQTHKGAVRRQIEYGKRRGLPWGISESCFNMVHANLDYQYRAFGVPGLGLKRGLSEDYVVAPYASLMALMIAPDEAYDNLRELAAAGLEGQWGFYEAIDY